MKDLIPSILLLVVALLLAFNTSRLPQAEFPTEKQKTDLPSIYAYQEKLKVIPVMAVTTKDHQTWCVKIDQAYTKYVFGKSTITHYIGFTLNDTICLGTVSSNNRGDLIITLIDRVIDVHHSNDVITKKLRDHELNLKRSIGQINTTV